MTNQTTLPALVANEIAAGARCPACNADGASAMVRQADVPVFCNVPAPTRAAARAATRAPIDLAACAGCGLLYNAAFDPSLVEYGAGYENALHHSGVFREYAEAMAAGLVERHGLSDGRAIEIGCGQGDFLALLCRHGMRDGFGFDPGFDPKRSTNLPESVSVAARPFAADALDPSADLVCCRHVLEHLDRPTELLSALRKRIDSAGGDPILYFEVPSALWMIRRLGVWDLIYEHCCYYTPTALRGVFARTGFEPITVEERYGGQFLTIEARIARNDATVEIDASPEDAELVDAFATAYRRRVDAWRTTLDRLRAAGERAVLWGAGSKGVTFLNVLRPSESSVPAVVDLNPYKQGRHIAGTGHPIIAPDDLAAIAPHHVIVMNPLYRDEIAADLDSRGIRATVLVA